MFVKLTIQLSSPVIFSLKFSQEAPLSKDAADLYGVRAKGNSCKRHLIFLMMPLESLERKTPGAMLFNADEHVSDEKEIVTP